MRPMAILPQAVTLAPQSTFITRRALIMTSPDPKLELMTLLNEQLCTLEKQLYGVVSEPEMREYEARRDRIVELYNEVTDRPAAA
jgi:hypothetical protein